MIGQGVEAEEEGGGVFSEFGHKEVVGVEVGCVCVPPHGRSCSSLSAYRAAERHRGVHLGDG